MNQMKSELPQDIIITAACGHRINVRVPAKGKRRTQVIEMFQREVCSTCWASEPQARARLRDALTSKPRTDWESPVGFSLELWAKWWLSMGSGTDSIYGNGTTSQHQLCLLANKLGEQRPELRDALNALLLELTDAVDRGEVEPLSESATTEAS